MSDAGTKRMLAAYQDEASSPMFLSSLFQTPPRNFHRSEKVEIDVLRNDPHIALPVQSIGAGARQHESSQYVNKAYTPPVYDLETTISAYDKLKRRAGMDPFEDPDFLGSAVQEAFRHLRELEDLIRRAVEVQCSQVLQTGVITLVDASGNTLYTLDFLPKSSHMTTASVAWAADGSTGDPLGDLASLAETVRKDGKREPNRLIFGRTAIQRFLANDDVKARLDNRAMTLGNVAPSDRGTGATFWGFVWIGLYRFEMWTYKETYIDPQTGNHVDFVDPENVIMTSQDARLDLTFGELPMFVPPEARAAQFLPSRMAMPEIGMGFTTNAWVTPDGKHLKLSAGTRPLAIPTAIDTFGRLDITP